MSSALSFTVPGEVRGKGRPRIVRLGRGDRAFTRLAADEKTVNYENLVALMATEAMQRAGMAAQHFTGPVVVELVAALVPAASTPKKLLAQMLGGLAPPTKKPDLDNIVKVLDALNGIVWKDDAQVVSFTAAKVYAERPALHLRISAWVPNLDVL